MDEGDAGAPPPGAGGLVDESRPLITQMLQGDVDRRHRESDVVQALASALEETANRCFGGKRPQQLDEGASHRDHCLLDSLGVHHFPVEGLDPVPTPVSVERSIQIVHGDRHVVEIEQLHQHEAKALIRPREQTPAAGSIPLQ